MNQIDVKYPYKVNVGALQEALAAALGFPVGLSVGPGRVQVLLPDAPTAEQEAAVRGVLDAHNPKALSQAQQAVKARRERLAQLQTADSPLAVADFAGESAAVRQLAQKVLLLEAQLRERDAPRA